MWSICPDKQRDKHKQKREKSLSLFQSLNSRLERASPKHQTKSSFKVSSFLFLKSPFSSERKQRNKSIKKDELSFINQTTVRLSAGRMSAQTPQLPVENSRNAVGSWRRRWGQRSEVLGGEGAPVSQVGSADRAGGVILRGGKQGQTGAATQLFSRVFKCLISVDQPSKTQSAYRVYIFI